MQEDKDFLKEFRKQHKLSQGDLAKLLSCSASYIGQIEIGKTPLSYEKREQINNLFPKEEETLSVPFYKEISGSCGPGIFAPDYDTEPDKLPIAIKYGLNPRLKYFAIPAFGNSMEETIHDKEIVIFEDWHNKQIIDHKIYFFAYEGRYYIKRLAFNIDEVIVTSDNKAKNENGTPIYEEKRIKKEDINKLYIYGRFKGKIERD